MGMCREVVVGIAESVRRLVYMAFVMGCSVLCVIYLRGLISRWKKC